MTSELFELGRGWALKLWNHPSLHFGFIVVDQVFQCRLMSQQQFLG